MYQFELVASHCIGWPISPGNLSVTLLIIVRGSPFVFLILIISGVCAVAALNVFANLISVALCLTV